MDSRNSSIALSIETPHLKSQNKTESLQEVEEIKQPGGCLGALGCQEPGRQVPVEGATSK